MPLTEAQRQQLDQIAQAALARGESDAAVQAQIDRAKAQMEAQAHEPSLLSRVATGVVLPGVLQGALTKISGPLAGILGATGGTALGDLYQLLSRPGALETLGQALRHPIETLQAWGPEATQASTEEAGRLGTTAGTAAALTFGLPMLQYLPRPSTLFGRAGTAAKTGLGAALGVYGPKVIAEHPLGALGLAAAEAAPRVGQFAERLVTPAGAQAARQTLRELEAVSPKLAAQARPVLGPLAERGTVWGAAKGELEDLAAWLRGRWPSAPPPPPGPPPSVTDLGSVRVSPQTVASTVQSLRATPTPPALPRGPIITPPPAPPPPSPAGLPAAPAPRGLLVAGRPAIALPESMAREAALAELERAASGGGTVPPATEALIREAEASLAPRAVAGVGQAAAEAALRPSLPTLVEPPATSPMAPPVAPTPARPRLPTLVEPPPGTRSVAPGVPPRPVEPPTRQDLQALQRLLTPETSPTITAPTGETPPDLQQLQEVLSQHGVTTPFPQSWYRYLEVPQEWVPPETTPTAPVAPEAPAPSTAPTGPPAGSAWAQDPFRRQDLIARLQQARAATRRPPPAPEPAPAPAPTGSTWAQDPGRRAELAARLRTARQPARTPATPRMQAQSPLLPTIPPEVAAEAQRRVADLTPTQVTELIEATRQGRGDLVADLARTMKVPTATAARALWRAATARLLPSE